MKFIVRKAEEKDLSSIEAIYNEKRDYPYSPFGREKRALFREMLDDRHHFLFIGERNDIPCAFLSMRIGHLFENSMKPSSIITDVKISGKDPEILCAIISRAVATAMENECCEITLYDKSVINESASVYSICGFRENRTFYTKKL